MLAVTASAVAKRVAAVEDLLGTPLFQRNGRTLKPTPACLDYLPPVRAALALLAQMPQHQRPHARAQRLRISAPPTFARLVLVPALDDFSRQHPGIDIEVVLSIPYLDNPALSAAQADVAVRHGDAAALGGTVLMHDVVLPVAAGRNLAVLLEAAVRSTILLLRGINSTQEFVERHQRALERLP